MNKKMIKCNYVEQTKIEYLRYNNIFDDEFQYYYIYVEDPNKYQEDNEDKYFIYSDEKYMKYYWGAYNTECFNMLFVDKKKERLLKLKKLGL